MMNESSSDMYNRWCHSKDQKEWSRIGRSQLLWSWPRKPFLLPIQFPTFKWLFLLFVVVVVCACVYIWVCTCECSGWSWISWSWSYWWSSTAWSGLENWTWVVWKTSSPLNQWAISTPTPFLFIFTIFFFLVIFFLFSTKPRGHVKTW